MELIKIENKISLNGKSFELIRTTERVFNSPLLKRLDSSVALDLLMQYLTKLYHDCGQKANGKDLVILSNELLNSLNSSYSWITISEIPQIFSLGRKKLFGDWFGLNLNTIEIWIEKYYSEKRADEVKKRRLDLKSIENKKPTPEENEKAFNNLLTELFLEYQSTKKISNVFLYSHLFDRGLLPKHTQRFNEFIKRRAIKKLYKKKGYKADTLVSIKRIALLKMAFKNGLNEREAIDILKKNKVKDLPKEDYKINKKIKLIQNGKKGLNDICKEIILIDFINKKVR